MNRVNARILPCELAPSGNRELLVDQDELERRTHCLIVTRYFLTLFSAKEAREMSEQEKRTWFAERELVFNRFTLPSIIGQKKQNKTWLLYIDQALVDYLPKSLTGPQRPEFIKIIEVDAADRNFSAFSQDVVERINACRQQMERDGVGQPIVTVSRLDNDDALSHDFLNTLARLALHAAGRADADRLVTFPHGVQYLEDKKLGTYLFNNNHFLSSYHAKHCEPKTVHAMAFNHSHLFSKNENVLVVNTDLPMWVEIVHGKNISNKYQSRSILMKTAEFDRRFNAVYPIEANLDERQSAQSAGFVSRWL